MPVLENDKLIKQYYESIKDKHPHLSFEAISKICSIPAKFIMKEMRRPDLPIIMVKRVGKILVNKSELKRQMADYEAKFRGGLMLREEFDKFMNFAKDYLKKLELYDSKPEIILEED